MRAVRIPLFVLLAVLFFILWNAAWITDRCGEWTAAVDTVTADLDAGGDGGAALGTLDDLWQDVQGYMHIIVSPRQHRRAVPRAGPAAPPVPAHRRNAAAQSQKYLLTVTSRSAAYSART